MTNELRNEVTVELAGRNILLRPTFGCLLEIESRTGKSIMQICEEIGQNALTISDIIIVFEEGTKAADSPQTKQELIDLMELVGLVTMQTATHEFFGNALYPGQVQSKKKSINTAK